jgi:hypothetical protein
MDKKWTKDGAGGLIVDAIQLELESRARRHDTPAIPCHEFSIFCPSFVHF